MDVIDYRSIPSAVMRCSLSYHDEYSAGVHFNQKLDDPTSTVITFYNHEGLRINNDTAKKVEKAFFKETFRRVDYSRIGQIYPSDHTKEYIGYKKGMKELLQSHMFKCLNCRVAVDMMHGMASEVFPDILNDMGVDHIMFNAHPDEHRLENINTLAKRSYEDMSAVIKALGLDAGFMIYPHGQRLDILCDKGVLLSKQAGLFVVLSLLNMEAKAIGSIKKVFLPTWAADFVQFEYLTIERGQYANFKSEQMKQYDLVTTGEGNFAFTEFSTHRDSMYATLKILEMIVNHGVKLSALIEALPRFYYHTFQVTCTQANKGKMMRMFLEDSKGKKSSTLDGVKIWLKTHDWVLMIPDQYSDNLNLYIQAESTEQGEQILETYTSKIEEWIHS
jgi:mannose-1-phosphate guanylyltransferase/phosphomannomutase